MFQFRETISASRIKIVGLFYLPQKGFHLLEIMITLSIVSILASVAIPSYLDKITETQRHAAEVELMKLAVTLEKYQTEHFSYRGATLAKLDFPTEIVKGNYLLQIQQATANHFKIAAIPQHAQARRDASCGVLMLDERNQRSVAGRAQVEECW